jgi:predicted alpha/beta-fold hydrolase
MALDLTALQAQVHDLYWNLPAGAQSARKPVVILLHGLSGDRNDWMSPFQERN